MIWRILLENGSPFWNVTMADPQSFTESRACCRTHGSEILYETEDLPRIPVPIDQVGNPFIFLLNLSVMESGFGTKSSSANDKTIFLTSFTWNPLWCRDYHFPASDHLIRQIADQIFVSIFWESFTRLKCYITVNILIGKSMSVGWIIDLSVKKICVKSFEVGSLMTLLENSPKLLPGLSCFFTDLQKITKSAGCRKINLMELCVPLSLYRQSQNRKIQYWKFQRFCRRLAVWNQQTKILFDKKDRAAGKLC